MVITDIDNDYSQYCGLNEFSIELQDFSQKWINENFNINLRDGNIGLTEEVMIQYEYLNEDSQMNDFMNTAGKGGITFLQFIGKLGISSISYYKEHALLVANIVKIIVKNGLNDRARTLICAEFDRSMSSICKGLNFSNIKELNLEDYDYNKIRKAIALLIFVYTLNNVEYVVLDKLLKGILVKGKFVAFDLSYFLTVSILSPINEELGKRISIKGKFEKEYFVVFNMFEFGLYVSKGRKQGIDLKLLAKLRILPIIMHATTTITQYILSNPAIMNILGKTQKESEQKAQFIATLCGMFIHITWNSAAMIATLTWDPFKNL